MENNVPKLGNEDVPKLGEDAEILNEKLDELLQLAYMSGYNRCKSELYTEEDIDKLLSFYTNDAPASYIKRDYKKYLSSLKQPK